MNLDLVDELLALVHAQPFGEAALRPPPAPGRLNEVAQHLGVPVPAFVREMYARHDGATMQVGRVRGLFLFPMWWEWMPLDHVVSEAEFALAWMKRGGLNAFPFALHGSGQFMVCEPGEVERVWQIESEPPSPGWPDGTVDGLLAATCDAYRGQSDEYRVEFSKGRMGWTASWEPEW